MTCEHKALALSALGLIILWSIFALDGVTASHNQLFFQNIWWRISWWAAWLSFLVGIAVAAFFCGSPASS
jgi:hypothetical protein